MYLNFFNDSLKASEYNFRKLLLQCCHPSQAGHKDSLNIGNFSSS